MSEEKFLTSCEYGHFYPQHIAYMQEYIAMGKEVNIQDSSARSSLSLAAYLGNAEQVNILIQAGANIDFVDGFGRSAFYLSCISLTEPCEKIELFIQAGITELIHFDKLPLYHQKLLEKRIELMNQNIINNQIAKNHTLKM